MGMNEKVMDNTDCTLSSILKDRLKDVVFLELKKDIFLQNGQRLSSSVPLPIMKKDLMSGIKGGQYGDDIPFEKFAKSMIFVIGCDSNFKYSSIYIDTIKGTSPGIEDYILSKALKLAKAKDYFNALIYFNALDKISDKHMEVRYNIALDIRSLSDQFKEKGNEKDYKLFDDISYHEFLKLSKDYPNLMGAHYYLGYYYVEMEMYNQAIAEWEKAFTLADEISQKDELRGLIDETRDKMDFEKGKDLVGSDGSMEALKILIPLSQKYEKWSELKFYTALAYRKTGNYPKALLILNELLKDGEDFSQIYSELGVCYINLGDIKKAIDNFEMALKKHPDEPGYLCNLGIAWYTAGNLGKAANLINKAYELKPDDEVTKKCWKWIEGLRSKSTKC